MSLYAKFTSKGPSGFGYASTAEEVTQGLDLHGKAILLTGCGSGLGLESLRVLTLRGARVMAIARTLDKARAACDSVSGETIPLGCELSEPENVRTCVDAVKRSGLELDAIIANAGIMALPRLNQKHGLELQFLTNHLGHFILVTGLIGQLKEDGRVVMLSSAAHQMAPKEGIQFDNLSGDKGYSAFRAYGQAKLANLLFAKELARRFQGTRRVANAVHPGVIDTNLSRYMNPVATFLFRGFGALVNKSIAQGAATQLYAAVHPNTATTSGVYFADCNIARKRPDADNPELARRLWEVSERLAAELA